MYNFKDFACNQCGWCCQRTPCPMGLFMGEKPMSSCGFLKETSPNNYECGLILDEIDPIKKEALKSLILSGEGCSHIYGPSPISLVRMAVAQGITPKHPSWEVVKQNTITEYEKMAKTSEHPDTIQHALNEFKQYCQEQENR
jgi:hypothetical protein